MSQAPDLTLETGLPANVDAEKTILGAVLLDNAAFAEAAERLQADDFSLDSHRRIFLRMSYLSDTYRAIDIVTLANELNRNKEVESVGGVAYLASLTEGLPRRARRDVAVRASLIAGAILIGTALLGDLLLRALGISLPAFRIAGGILLLLLSIDMVFARKSGIRWTTAAETEEAEESVDVAVFPLAIPLIAGPGALTSVILLMGRAHGDLVLQAIVIGLMLLILGLCLVAFLLAMPLMDRLGVTGINVVDRVFGVILAALAVQNVLDGAIEVLMSLRQ